MPARLLYRPGERLSGTELSAARLDGHVVEVGEAFLPADTVEGPAVRAAAIADLVPEGFAGCRATAAWVLGAGDAPPAIHHVRRAASKRGRTTYSQRVVFHDAVLADADIVVHGGVQVANTIACGMELAFSGLDSEADRRWLSALIAVSPGAAEQIRTRLLALPPRPYRNRAAMLIERLQDVACAQEVVTR